MKTITEKTYALVRRPAFHWAVLFLAALAFRLFQLDRMSFWIDEARTVYDVSRPLGNLYHTTVHFTNPPLFHYLARPFYVFFGRDEFWLRFPAAIFGALAVPAAYGMLRRWLGVPAAFAGALFILLSPFHIWYSQEFRMYSLVALEGLVSTWLWVRARETDSVAAWWGYAAVTVAGLYTHYWFLFFAAAQGLWLAGEFAAGKRRPIAVLEPLLFVPLAYLPWIPAMIRQIYEDDLNFLVAPGPGELFQVSQAFLLGLTQPYGVWAAQGPGALKVLFYIVSGALPLLGAFWPGKERKRFAEIYLVGFAVPLAFAYLFSVFAMPIFSASRYTIVLFPAYALALSRLTEIRGPWARGTLATLAAAWLGIAGVTLHHHYFTIDKSPARDVWRYIQEQSGDFQVIDEFLPMNDRFVLKYYAGRSLSEAWGIERLPPRHRQDKPSPDLIIPFVSQDWNVIGRRLSDDWKVRSHIRVRWLDVVRLTRAGS